VVTFWPFISCRDGLIAAPSGSTILLSASPEQIAVNGESEITALVRLKDGSPAGDNHEVLFFTNFGTIDESAVTDTTPLAT
jgi:hypothetical protein